MKATIYKLTNTITGMSYIGVTKTSLKKRMSSHRSEASRGVKSEIYKAMREYGYINFKIEEIEKCKEGTMFKAEEAHIKSLNTMWPRGYNTSSSHLLGGTQSSVVKEKKSKAQLKRWNVELRKEWSVKMLRMFNNPKHKETHSKAVAKSNKLHSSRLVIGTSILTDEVRIFESVSGAAKFVGGSHSKVSNVCTGKRSSHKQWAFSYLE